jgi:4,5-dihydroxyphthalate decarboxylase
VGDVRTDAADIRPLIPDARNAGFEYFRKTGVYPINHCVVVKNAVLEEDPRVAEELFYAFKTAKAAHLARLREGRDLSSADEAAIDLARVVGGDPFPFGVRANRKAIETIVRFAVEQRAIPEKPGVEDLFARNTLELE